VKPYMAVGNLRSMSPTSLSPEQPMPGARRLSNIGYAKGLLADSIGSIAANTFPENLIPLHGFRLSTCSSDPHHHLAARLARFHQLVRLADFLKPKYAYRFCFILASGDIFRDGLEWDVRQWKPGVPKTKLPKKLK
jgi:hypothetical protein